MDLKIRGSIKSVDFKTICGDVHVFSDHFSHTSVPAPIHELSTIFDCFFISGVGCLVYSTLCLPRIYRMCCAGSANPKGIPVQLYNYFDPDVADNLLASFEQLPEARLQLVEL